MLCLPMWRFAACLCLLHNLSLVLAKSGYPKASLWSHFDHCGAVDTLVISGIKSNIILKIINMQIRKQSLSDLPHSHLKWIQQMIKWLVFRSPPSRSAFPEICHFLILCCWSFILLYKLTAFYVLLHSVSVTNMLHLAKAASRDNSQMWPRDSSNLQKGCKHATKCTESFTERDC